MQSLHCKRHWPNTQSKQQHYMYRYNNDISNSYEDKILFDCLEVLQWRKSLCIRVYESIYTIYGLYILEAHKLALLLQPWYWTCVRLSLWRIRFGIHGLWDSLQKCYLLLAAYLLMLNDKPMIARFSCIEFLAVTRKTQTTLEPLHYLIFILIG